MLVIFFNENIEILGNFSKICIVGPSWPSETHGFFANKLLVVWKEFESKSPIYMVKSIAV